MDTRPREVALTVIRRASDGAVLLGIGTDPATGLQFCRPVGGGIEAGESPEEAARREIREEIGGELADLRPLEVVDNRFVYAGKPGREITHLFESRWADPALEERAEFAVAKKSLPRIARWFPPEHLRPGLVPAVPAGIEKHLGPRLAVAPLRMVAVDWSGAASGEEKGIWIAEASGGRLLRLECGRSREEVASHLLGFARARESILAGLDFAFSLPGWFLEERGLRCGPDLWDLASREGEAWLRECRPPFWGRAGRTRPDLPAHFRAADDGVPPVKGIRPKSPFQVGGAGAVGTGSVRGMPILKALRDGGFAVWPFEPLRLPAGVEIYPRGLTGPVVKSDPKARWAFLAAECPGMDPDMRALAASDDNAFDAALSALSMDAHRGELLSLPPARDDRERREGRIWIPWEETPAARQPRK
jgi:8-oxo-dGTP pyrophosphatase MutT (NUDIX family)